jgi:hypothetical protein
MNTYLKKYIDNQIIREYANKDLKYYSCQLVDVPQHEQETLIDIIAVHDAGFREAILDYVQSLINERVMIVENEDRFSEGYRAKQDPITGEQNWDIPIGGF